jgi:hypothetical protein
VNEIIRLSSIGEVHRLLPLEKPSHPLVSVFPINDHVVNFDYRDAKYVFDFYQINFKEGFSGSLLYGRNSYDFEEGSLIFVKPGQTIQMDSPEMVEDSSGWVLLFHPDLLSKSALGKTIDDYSFFDYEVIKTFFNSKKKLRYL